MSNIEIVSHITKHSADLPVQEPKRAGNIDELISLVSFANDHPALGEHRWFVPSQLAHNDFVDFAAFDTDILVGYAQLNGRSGTWSVETAVHPNYADVGTPSDAVAVKLLSAALEEIVAMGGGRVYYWVPKPTPFDDMLSDAAGFIHDRDLLQMRRALPLEDSIQRPHIQLKPFESEKDNSAWLEVNNKAFLTHPEQGGWTMETLIERQSEPWFDAKGFLVYEQLGRLIGSCWTKIHSDQSPPLGEIYVVSVDPDYQGKGLGRQLTVAGLDWLTSRGLDTAMLYVDLTNEKALNLYKSIGFIKDHTDRAYIKDV
ncbi:MAG: mycothiol synthase [Actinobacteria bacterium]|nr:mycothiol synthase [Actinomycetota bacterium]MCL6105658.1 mycothiol synthase [Actinomycetota bacterium]